MEPEEFRRPLMAFRRRGEAATKEVNQDVQKPIQQLICDVHEQAQQPGLTEQQKQSWMMVRMVSMMGQVALEHERNHKWLVILTWGDRRFNGRVGRVDDSSCTPWIGSRPLLARLASFSLHLAKSLRLLKELSMELALFPARRNSTFQALYLSLLRTTPSFLPSRD